MKKSILKYFKAFTLIGVMASFIALSSCGDDDGGEPAATETVWGLIESTENLSALESELSVFADLVATLDNEDANLTVFAPTDAALGQLLNTLQLDDFSPVNQDIAKAVLAYHVVTSARIASGDVVEGETFTTAQGEMITVGPGGVLVSGATSVSEISSPDIQATNGVVHLVSVVLVPPTIGGQIVATLGTVSQPIFLGKDFTLLAQAIGFADSDNVDGGADEGEDSILDLLKDRTLTGENQITVFAPTNATFAGAGITSENLTSVYDEATWEAILKNHIVQGQGDDSEADDNTLTLDLGDLVEGASFFSLIQVPLSISVGDPGLIAGDQGTIGIYIDSDLDQTANGELVLPDADGGTSTNGRVHVIAGVLAPPQ